MAHCGINGWDVLMESREESDRRYLDNHLKRTSQLKKRSNFGEKSFDCIDLTTMLN